MSAEYDRNEGAGATERDSLVVERLVRCSRRRLIAGRAVSALLDGAVFALLATLAFGGLAGSLGLGSSGWRAFGLVLLAMLVAYLAHEMFFGSSRLDVALLLDERLGLGDRLSSWLFFERRARQGAFMRAHLAETAGALVRSGARPLPFPAPRRLRAFVLFCAIGLVALLPHAEHASPGEQQRVLAIARKAKRARNLSRELGRVEREAGLRGLPRLAGMIATAERQLAARVDLLAKLQTKARPAEKKPAAQSDERWRNEKAATARLRGRAPGTGPGVRLAGSATYRPTGKFDSFPDSAYAATFAELDERLLDGDLTPEQLSALARHLEGAADRFSSMGYENDHQAEMVERATLSHDGEDVEAKAGGNSFDRALKPLQQKSFSEFLMRYAAHIGNQALGRLRFEPGSSGNRQPIGVPGGTRPPAGSTAPPSKQDTDAMRPAAQAAAQTTAGAKAGATAQATARAAAGSGAPKKSKLGGGTSPGGAGAGAGGGERQAGAPPVLPRALGGEYLKLRGKLSDGKAVVQLISRRGRGGEQSAASVSGTPTDQPLSYREVFVQYARGAEAEMTGERVPLQMRDYIRDYFRSIRPVRK